MKRLKKFKFLLKNYLLLLTITISLLCSCGYFQNTSNNTNEKGSVITSDIMIDLLTDIHLIEAAIKLKQLENKDTYLYSQIYYSMLLKKYNVSIPEIRNSLEYYMQNTSEFEVIYSELINSMTQMQGLLAASKNPTQSFSGMSLQNRIKRFQQDTL